MQDVGLGFAPQGYIQNLEFNKNNRRRQQAIDSRRSKLLRKRNMALREGDLQEVQKIDQEIVEFNQGLPSAPKIKNHCKNQRAVTCRFR